MPATAVAGSSRPSSSLACPLGSPQHALCCVRGAPCAPHDSLTALRMFRAAVRQAVRAAPSYERVAVGAPATPALYAVTATQDSPIQPMVKDGAEKDTSNTIVTDRCASGGGNQGGRNGKGRGQGRGQGGKRGGKPQRVEQTPALSYTEDVEFRTGEPTTPLCWF